MKEFLLRNKRNRITGKYKNMNSSQKQDIEQYIPRYEKYMQYHLNNWGKKDDFQTLDNRQHRTVIPEREETNEGVL